MVVVRVQGAFFVAMFIILLLSGTGLHGLFHLVLAKDGFGQKNPSFGREERKAQQTNNSAVTQQLETPEIIEMPEDLVNILPDLALDFISNSDHLVQQPKTMVNHDQEAFVADVGFYNKHRRTWYGRYGGVHHNDSGKDSLRIEGELFVHVVVSGSLDDEEIRIEIRRDIVNSPGTSVVSKFITKSISIEDNGSVQIVTEPFRIDSYSDGYTFGNESGNLRGYYVDVAIGNETAFGNEKRTFYSGKLSMLNPYVDEHNGKRDTDGDGLSDGVEGQDRDFQYWSSPTNADTDFDGLSDFLEHENGLDPSNNDSDGDNLSDLWEFVFENSSAGISPLTSQSQDEFLDADPDGDGLTMQQEAKAGTSPFSASTDSVYRKRDESIYNVTYIEPSETGILATPFEERTVIMDETSTNSNMSNEEEIHPVNIVVESIIFFIVLLKENTIFIVLLDIILIALLSIAYILSSLRKRKQLPNA